jgi:hypothetical protein
MNPPPRSRVWKPLGLVSLYGAQTAEISGRYGRSLGQRNSFGHGLRINVEPFRDDRDAQQPCDGSGPVSQIAEQAVSSQDHKLSGSEHQTRKRRLNERIPAGVASRSDVYAARHEPIAERDLRGHGKLLKCSYFFMDTERITAHTCPVGARWGPECV